MKIGILVRGAGLSPCRFSCIAWSSDCDVGVQSSDAEMLRDKKHSVKLPGIHIPNLLIL